MTDLEARLIRIERVVENQSLVQLASELETLRSETTALRGELETLRFETENSDSRQRELYVDVDRRLQTLETRRGRSSRRRRPRRRSMRRRRCAGRSAAGRRGAPGRQRPTELPGGVRLDCRRAGTTKPAAAFETFLAQFPTSPLADNARVLARRDALRARSVRRRAARVPQGHRAISAVRQGARCAAEDRLSARSSSVIALQREPRCRKSCANSPTRRPRGSRRSGSTACRRGTGRMPWPRRRSRSLPARG